MPSSLPETVREIMTEGVVTVKSDKTVLHAAMLMAKRHIGCLIVGDTTTVEGVMTERDIVTRIVANGIDPRMSRVEEFMTKPVVTCKPDMKISDALKLMARNNIRRLPVVENDKLVGIVTIRDVLTHGLL